MTQPSDIPDSEQMYASPPDPPDTHAEYLVSWVYPDSAIGVVRRRVFHSYEKACAYRTHLERRERGLLDTTYVRISVTIHERGVRPWREIA